MFCLIGLYWLWRLQKFGFLFYFFRRNPQNTNPYDTEANVHPLPTGVELRPPQRPRPTSQPQPYTTSNAYVNGHSQGHGIAPSPIPIRPWKPGLLADTYFNIKERAYDSNQTLGHGNSTQSTSRDHASGAYGTEITHDVENQSSSDVSGSLRSSPHFSKRSRHFVAAEPMALARSDITRANQAAFQPTYVQTPASPRKQRKNDVARRESNPFETSGESSSIIDVTQGNTAAQLYTPTPIHPPQKPSRREIPTAEAFARSVNAQSTINRYRENSSNEYGATVVRRMSSRDVCSEDFENVDLGTEKGLHHAKTFATETGLFKKR